MLILLGVSCLAWVGVLAAGATWIFGGSVPVGWLVAGALFAVLAIWFVVMFRELLRSAELPEQFEENEESNRSTPAGRRIASTRRRSLTERLGAASESACAIRVAPRPDRLVETRVNFMMETQSRSRH